MSCQESLWPIQHDGPSSVQKQRKALLFKNFLTCSHCYIYLIPVGLCWVFAAASGLSLVAMHRPLIQGLRLVRNTGPRCRGSVVATCWPQGVQASAVVAQRRISGGSQALEHAGFSSCGVWTLWLCGAWNLPGPGIEPVSLH